MNTKTVKVDLLTRVEGEGSLSVVLENGVVKELQLKIFEPPRFFEALLRGRNFQEAPDITARICGICPVAYQMSACAAMEDALGLHISEEVRLLRRLLYCGEWIESHVLHIYMLHAPDFCGFDSGISMAKVFPEEIRRGLRLKQAGNEIVKLLGGREIHPINVKIGGFYQLPRLEAWKAVKDKLLWAREAALQTLNWCAKFEFPDFRQDYEFVALAHDQEYPFCEGLVRSSAGLNIAVNEFEQHFREEQLPHSNALHCRRIGHGAYLVGPLARYTLNHKVLPYFIQSVAKTAGLQAPCQNAYQSILVRCVEVYYACEEALRVIDLGIDSQGKTPSLNPRQGIGFGCTEAPRGLLYHRYQVDDQGLIVKATIIPPTSQNQARIEADLSHLVTGKQSLTELELADLCEKMVRNHDPCISCATHFLKLDLKKLPQGQP